MKQKPEIFLNDAHGIYIPTLFAQSIRHDCVTDVDADDWDIIESGPDHEFYWDAWTDILDSARITDPSTGAVYTLYHDGDLWLIPDGMEWDDTREFFAWPRDDND